MIPILFKEDEQIFTHNGIGALYESLSCDVIEEENGAFTMELEYPVDGELFSEIKDFRIIQAKPNDIDDPHNFRIYEIEKSIDELTVYVRANTRTNDLGNNLITNYVGKNVTPQQAMNGIKSNLIEETNFDLISDIQTRSNVEWTRINPLNAIVGVRGSLVDIWGGQIKRTNTAIHLYSRRGRDNVVTIRPGKNIEGLNMTVSTAGLVTKILPTFSYRPVDVPKYQMVTMHDGTIEKQRVSTSGSTTLRDDITVLGNVVSSQHVDNYPTNYWSSVDYGDDNELRETVDDYIDTRLTEAEESPTILDMSGFEQELENFVKTELDKRAKQYFTHRNPGADKPTVRITVDMLQLSDSPDWEEFKDLERIGLTDTLDVWVEEYDIDVEVRVTSLTYDSIAEHVTNLNAGSDRAPRQSAMEKKYDDLTKSTNDYITSFKNGVQNIMRNTADGLNRKFEGYTEPPAELSSEGDIWFKQIGEGKVEIWIHDGVYWQPLLTEEFANQIQADIEAVQSELDAAKLQAVEDSEQALTDAKAYAEAEDARIRGELESDIGGAITLAEEAKADAETKANQALTDAKAHADAEIVLIGTYFDDVIEGVESDVADAKQTADAAVEQIDTAVTNAGFTSLDETINSVQSISNTAQTNAQTALDQSLEALGDASTALTNAQTAIGSASDAATIAGNALTKADEAQDAADILSGQVSGFETTLTGFNQRVNNYEGQVSGFRNDILGLESTVASYETEVDEFGNTVATYATEVSSLTNTVSGFESTVATYSTEVSDLTGEVAGYKNQVSTLNNTVAGFNSTVANYTTEVNQFGVEVASYATEVSTLTNTVNGFQSTVSRVEQDYEDVSGTVATHTTQISNLDGEIALKANTSTVNTLTGRVSTAETGITANATAIGLKANTTTVNALTGRVSTAETSITANATAIGLKASQSSVDTLSGTVNSLGADIGVVAGQISSKVWNTDIQTAVDNIEVGGRNLIPAFTSDRWSIHSSISVEGDYVISQPGGSTASIDIDVEANTEYTYTFNSDYGRSSVSGLIEGSVNETIFGLTTGSFVRTFNSGNNDQIRIHISKYSQETRTATTSKLKLEKGNKATDWTPAPEDTTSHINHVETTLTQKHDAIEATIQSVQTDLTGTTTLLNTTKSTVDGHVSTIATLRTDVDGKATTAQFNTLTSTVNGTVTRVGDAEGRLTTVETNVDGLQTTVASKAAQSQVTQLSTSLTSTITAVEDNATQISQNATNINLRVSKGDVINQINVSTEGILIDGSRTHITGTTTIDNGVIKNAHIEDLHASKINAGTISAARLNAGAIVTAGLSANVITSTHIATSTATVDKIFATDVMINRLTAKTAFITSVKAVDIDAARITSGTINAARLDASAIVTAGLTANVVKSTHISADTALFDMLFSTSSATDRLVARGAWITTANIANAAITNAKIADGTIKSAKIESLDVSKISGNTSNFVSTAWNTSANGSVYIDGDGIHSYGSDGDNIRIDDGLVRFYSNTGAYNGAIGTSYHVDEYAYSGVLVNMEYGKPFSVVRSKTSSSPVDENDRILYVPPYNRELMLYGDLRFNGTRSIYSDDSEMFRFYDDAISIYQTVNFGSNEINNINRIRFSNQAGRIASTETSLHLGANSELRLGNYSGDTFSEAMLINVGGTRLAAHMNVNGQTLNNMGSVVFEGGRMGSNATNLNIGGFTNLNLGRYLGNTFTAQLMVSVGGTRLENQLNANNQNINNVGTITSNRYMVGSAGRMVVSSSNIRVGSSGEVHLGTYSGETFNQVLDIASGGMRAQKQLNMNGFNISNSPSISDASLKDIYGLRDEDDLEKLMQIEYVDFKWKDEEYGGDDFGFIAQQVQSIVPEVIVETADGMLGYNSQSYVNFLGHSVQQLALREQNTNKVASQALQATETNEEKIEQLQQELSEANRRIEELESAI